MFKHFKEPSIDETLKWKVIGLYNSRARDGLVQLDLTNNDEVLKFITENKVRFFSCLIRSKIYKKKIT